MTPEQAAQRLAAVNPPAVTKLVKGALRAGAGRIKRLAVKEFLSRGIGRGVYVRDAGGATKRGRAAKGKKAALRLLTVSRVETPEPMVATATATSKGLAALAETGGRIRPHTIESAGPRKLLKIGPADVVSTSKNPVRHPGATVPQVQAMSKALATEQPKITADITRRVDKMLVDLGI